MSYQILEHTADLRIRVFGKDLKELLISAALAMASEQGLPGEKKTAMGGWETIKIESPDIKLLLVDWLNEILYRSDVQEKIYNEFIVEKLTEEPAVLEANIRGLVVEQKKIDIKAATYHNIEIVKTADGYEAEIIFDI